MVLRLFTINVVGPKIGVSHCMKSNLLNLKYLEEILFPIYQWEKMIVSYNIVFKMLRFFSKSYKVLTSYFLVKDSETGIAKLKINHPEKCNALTGKQSFIMSRLLLQDGVKCVTNYTKLLLLLFLSLFLIILKRKDKNYYIFCPILF